MRLELQELVRAPLERAFALAVDIDRAAEWLPREVRVEKLTEGPLRVGTRYRETRPVLGRLDVQVYEVSVLDPPRRSEVLADGPQGRFRFRLDFAAAGPDATRLTLSGEADRLGCLGVIAAPLVRRVMRANMAVDLAGLKAWIERVR